MDDQEKKPENGSSSFQRLHYPDISLRSANALVIGCCIVFVLMVIAFTIFK
ncbi:MAG: hypothetical protein FWC47_04820 [Oscillospiraceae bacterium]|nr:hypothetical protein [Oscillospiraceae bacterium]